MDNSSCNLSGRGHVHDAALATGSCKDGRPLSQPECTAYSSGIAPETCRRDGLHLCSQCKLVKYCSKSCQTVHWTEHKSDCKSPYSKSDWTTEWAREGRVPAFVTSAEDDEVSHTGFGHALHYVWGNLPAVDCINLPSNEGAGALDKDFTLAFVASGDLRNMISTINSLPGDYTGKIRILLNDIDITVAGRNASILFILLSDSGLEIEEAAELCLHLQYSAALTYKQASYVAQRLSTLFSGRTSAYGHWMCDKEIPLRGGGMLHMSLTEISEMLGMMTSTYSWSTAIHFMHQIVLAPSRKDYLDRYLFALRGPHRVAEMHLRTTGVVLPFGAATAHFTEPNRLLFNRDGRWLSPDCASQLSGWDLREVITSGQKHGCTEQDIYGCLYFHVRDHFIEFAKRARQLKINLHVTNMNALSLPRTIVSERQDCLRHFSVGSFDRVETSNVMDYVGPETLIKAWAPMLNRDNRHATLMLSSMNWSLCAERGRAISVCEKGDHIMNMMMQRCAQYANIDLRAMLASRGRPESNPALSEILQNMDSFYDNESAFRVHKEKLGIEKTAAYHRLTVKVNNTISPERIAYPMCTQPKSIPPYSKDDWYLLCCLGSVNGTERYLELAVV